MPDADWNESKSACCEIDHAAAGLSVRGQLIASATAIAASPPPSPPPATAARHQPSSRPDGRRCRMRNGRCRSSHKWLPISSPASCAAVRSDAIRVRSALDAAGVSAVAIISTSKPAMCRRRCDDDAASALFMGSSPLRRRKIVHCKKAPYWPSIGRQIWRPRSLIIQVKCGTFTATDRFIRCPAQSER